jgi:hypothetical protein
VFPDPQVKEVAYDDLRPGSREPIGAFVRAVGQGANLVAADHARRPRHQKRTDESCSPSWYSSV